jgi:hypothetical protein
MEILYNTESDMNIGENGEPEISGSDCGKYEDDCLLSWI